MLREFSETFGNPEELSDSRANPATGRTGYERARRTRSNRDRSPMKLTGPRRPDPTDDTETPVELPQVLITVAADGTLTATVDGRLFPSPEETAWTRATFGSLMDAITK